jgi:hypothetical protein
MYHVIADTINGTFKIVKHDFEVREFMQENHSKSDYVVFRMTPDDSIAMLVRQIGFDPENRIA